MPELLSSLANGLIIGFILFQIGINTPIILTKLTPESAIIVLRTIFPRFFLSIFFFSFISFISLFMSTLTGLVVNISIVTIILASVCYPIIPATNNAKDAGNDGLYSFYHNISVFSTMIFLAVNLIS